MQDVRYALNPGHNQSACSTRTRGALCREWAYEGAIVFDSFDNFKTYMGSKERDELITPILGEIQKYAKGDIYMGNRVYDEWM